MERLSNIHPGDILIEEFLKPLKLSAYKLSRDLKIPHSLIYQILKGRKRITVNTALKLGVYFGNSAKFWIGLQDDFDIEKVIFTKYEILERINSRGSINK